MLSNLLLNSTISSSFLVLGLSHDVLVVVLCGGGGGGTILDGMSLKTDDGGSSTGRLIL